MDDRALNTTPCPFAHTPNAVGQRHDLADHLIATAELAATFGADFGAANDCYAAGLWHDIGKVSPAFQAYLAACEAGQFHPRVDHKTAGAYLAATRPATAHLAQIILGHHGGMPDPGDAGAHLSRHQGAEDITQATRWAAATLPAASEPRSLARLTAADRDLRMRLIFSAVVDADFLDTEAHFDADRGRARRPAEPNTIAHLADREADAHTTFLRARQRITAVDKIRADIRDAALLTSAEPPGLFRLTVPTGGGKTRTALAFGLQHAAHHGLRRIVTAVPFLTVTDQTAQVYREILGHRAVLEHHSGLDPERQDADPAHRMWSRLAAENWDASVVVTTTVQLFESLFSNRPSALRKAHRLARSVIILDEAQALRLAVLGVTVDLLAAFAHQAGSTVVFCTATQPAVEEVSELLAGSVTQVVSDFESHFSALRRVSFEVPARVERWSWARVAERARDEQQALIIVNRRRDALAVLDEMPPGTLHLSTLLCAAHRRTVLAAVHDLLDRGAPCHVVATQVVEAGVDLDFPLVLRALAPFDSVAQAAGRCNREGRRDSGLCVVFRPEATDSFGEYGRGRDVMTAMLHDGAVDFGSPADCQRYFHTLYGAGSEKAATLDKYHLRAAIGDARFATVAGIYRLIEDATTPVVVPYPPVRRRIDLLLGRAERAAEPASSRRLVRQLQPYVVSLRQHDLAQATRLGLVSARAGLRVWVGDYDMREGVGTVLRRPDAAAGNGASQE